ncbi:MAG: hypothetical protein JWL88_100 [Parcubacteria group bacterium]|nr:hypothetical protein [Parcubacteria group bacterium]
MNSESERLADVVEQADKFSQGNELNLLIATGVVGEQSVRSGLSLKGLEEALGLDIERAIINLRIDSVPWISEENAKSAIYSYGSIGYVGGVGSMGGEYHNYVLTPTRWPTVYAYFLSTYYECAGGTELRLVRASDEWFSEQLHTFEEKKSTIPFQLFMLDDPKLADRMKGMRDLHKEKRLAFENELEQIRQARLHSDEQRRIKKEKRDRNPFVRFYRYLTTGILT